MAVRPPRVVNYLIWVLLAVLAMGQPAARALSTTSSGVLGVHAGPDSHELQGKTYVALGDSISAGRFATEPDDTFPALIADRLGMNLDLVAHSGAKAAWALPQLGAIQQTQPALITIELGTNDVGFHTPGGVFTAQYEAIVATVS